ncbi:hypothetical protein ABZ682_19210 [Streptomyces griseoviridis]|uniref:hypothetical protein n=1 Tax=Streptomyces griseoviridis TaxID=45398 RepID=UPI00340CCE07
MRILMSTWAPPDEDLDEELAARIVDILENERHFERRTYSTDSSGQTIAQVTVCQFTDPGTGSERWAVVQEVHDGREFADTAAREEAHAVYEEQVRDREGSEGGAPAWQISDVAGVPLDTYTLTVERRDEDGCWTYGGRRGGEWESRLGQDVNPVADGVMTTLEDALAVTLAAVAAEQERINEVVVLERAIGVRPTDDEAYAVRGTEETGEVTLTGMREIERPAEPTDDQAAAYVRHLRASALAR